MKLKIREIAILEDCSKRQILRYTDEGYQGHILKAERVGNRLLVDEHDYRQWRLECGFDKPGPEPNPQAQVETVKPEPEPTPEPLRIGTPVHCRPACPGAPLTNVPTAQSGNWAHPVAIKEHLEQNARDLIASFGGTTK